MKSTFETTLLSAVCTVNLTVYLAAYLYMAAFRSAAIRSDCNSTKLCSYPFPTTRACTLRPSRFCPKPLLSQRSAQRQSKLFLPRKLRVKCQAASDIALPGPGGHAEDVVLPEAGLLNPSVLNSQYDSEIVGLAIPALGSILLDPFLSLVDTGTMYLHNIQMHAMLACLCVSIVETILI